MLRIATLGTLRNNIAAQSRFWDFDWMHIDADQPTADGRPHEVDVLLSMIYRQADTKKVTFRLLHALGAGLDKIEFDVLPADATVCNMFGHEIPMAEYCVSAILNAAIDWRGMTEAFRTKSWGAAYHSRVRRPELAGKTVGIIGMGHIGTEVAKRLAGFDVRILGIASKARAAPAGVAWVRGPEAVGDLVAEADFIVLSAALTEDTRNIVDAAAIGRMKPNAYIINVGRGGLIEEAPFYEALRSGRILGATLDTWYNYPTGAEDTIAPASLPFADLPNVVPTPHSSAWTAELADRRHRFLADNLRNFIAGRPLMNVVHAPAGG